MINNVLTYLKQYLKSYLAERGLDYDVDLVGLSRDAASEKESSIQICLLHIEEERSLKSQDPYSYRYYQNEKGKKSVEIKQTNPEIMVNLYIIVMAVDHNYETALGLISNVLCAFQRKSYFPAEESRLSSSKEMPDISVEIQPMTFSEANHLAENLSGRRMPFVVYKIKTVVIEDHENAVEVPDIQEVIIKEINTI